MNKELPLDERIQKLFESGWVNEFNYLENQLQEARYLLACLNEKYKQLTNNWKELEEYLKGLIDNFKEDVSTPILHEQLAIEMIYEYMQEIKEGNK